MNIPPTPDASIQLPSLYFKVKRTNKIGKAYEAHWDGIHFRFERDIRWYTLEEVEPITEKEFFVYLIILEWFDYCFVNSVGDYKTFIERYGNVLDEKRYNELMDEQAKQYDHYAQFSIHN